MQSYVKIAGREALVEVESGDRAGLVRVTVDGKAYEVDVSDAGSAAGALSLLIDGRQVEVFSRRERSDGGAKTYELGIDGRQFSATVADPLAHLAQESAGGAGAERVDAYMPGRVVALLVEQGAEVEPGQGVLVLEAMKMENEIAAETGGIVQEFFVEVGQAVEGGDPLFQVVAVEAGESP